MEKGSANLKNDGRLAQLFRQNDGFVTRKDAVAERIDPHELSEWVETGRAERIQPGIYRAVDAPPLSNEFLLEVILRAPQGVVALRSALDFHNLGTISPSAIDLAIPRKSHAPTFGYPPVNFFYFNDPMISYGVEEHSLGPTKLRVFSPEKTLADLLYYRNTIGISTFVEGLQDYLAKPGANTAALMEAAQKRRVATTIRPYLEALL